MASIVPDWDKILEKFTIFYNSEYFLMSPNLEELVLFLGELICELVSMSAVCLLFRKSYKTTLKLNYIIKICQKAQSEVHDKFKPLDILPQQNSIYLL